VGEVCATSKPDTVRESIPSKTETRCTVMCGSNWINRTNPATSGWYRRSAYILKVRSVPTDSRRHTRTRSIPVVRGRQTRLHSKKTAAPLRRRSEEYGQTPETLGASVLRSEPASSACDPALLICQRILGVRFGPWSMRAAFRP